MKCLISPPYRWWVRIYVPKCASCICTPVVKWPPYSYYIYFFSNKELPAVTLHVLLFYINWPIHPIIKMFKLCHFKEKTNFIRKYCANIAKQTYPLRQKVSNFLIIEFYSRFHLYLILWIKVCTFQVHVTFAWNL